MFSRFNRISAAVLAGAAASFVIPNSAVFAQEPVIYVQTAPPANVRILRVPYGDLNLLTRAGEQTLNRRVSRAIENVCLYDNGRWYGMGEPDYNYCSWGAWQRARPQIAGAIYQARQLAYYGVRRSYYPG